MREAKLDVGTPWLEEALLNHDYWGLGFRVNRAITYNLTCTCW